MKAIVIDESDIKDLKESKKIYDGKEAKILERITYIFETIGNVFGNKLKFWYFVDASENSHGDFLSNCDITDEFFPYVEHEYKVKRGGSIVMNFLLKDGTECELSNDNDDSFSMRWLLEDFEEELIEGKKKYEEKQRAKKEAYEQHKVKGKQDKLLAKRAIKKLSKEEQEAIKNSLKKA